MEAPDKQRPEKLRDMIKIGNNAEAIPSEPAEEVSEFFFFLLFSYM